MSSRHGKRVSLDRSGRVDAGEGERHTCIVKDISAAGARLLLPEAGDVPDRFHLSLDPSGDRWPCRVVWRQIGEVGVAFN